MVMFFVVLNIIEGGSTFKDRDDRPDPYNRNFRDRDWW
jgi:hypothetical protein